MYILRKNNLTDKENWNLRKIAYIILVIFVFTITSYNKAYNKLNKNIDSKNIDIVKAESFGSNEKLNILKFNKTDYEHHTYKSSVGISVNSIGDIAIGFDDKYINI